MTNHPPSMQSSICGFPPAATQPSRIASGASAAALRSQTAGSGRPGRLPFPPGLRYFSRSLQPARCAPLRYQQVGVRKARITQPSSKFELWRGLRLAFSPVFSFKHLMVVREETVWPARIRNRQLAAGIHIAKENVRDRLSAFIAGVVSHEDRLGGAGDAVDDA